MKRQFLIALVSILLYTSCSKEENLAIEVEGMWQLTEMWDGDEVEHCDDIFYGFQNNLINVKLVRRGIDNYSISYYGKYHCENDSIYFPILSGADYGISPELRLEQKQGIEYVNKFRIEKLSRSQMIWTRGDDERFVFRSY